MDDEVGLHLLRACTKPFSRHCQSNSVEDFLPFSQVPFHFLLAQKKVEKEKRRAVNRLAYASRTSQS